MIYISNRRDMANSADLLFELVKSNFKLRYNNSFLGFVWVLIRPLATFLILYTVWTAFRGQGVPNYQSKLLLGILLFTFVNEAIIFGMNGLLDKAHIILKVNFPREIAVMSSVLMAVINLSINLVIFFILGIFNNIHPTFLSFLWFLLTCLASVSIIYGICLFLAVWIIRLRDLQHIFELFFQLLFWVTPIFYEVGENIGQIGGFVGKVISLNPLGMFINIARSVLIEGKIDYLVIWNTEVHSAIVVTLGLFLGLLLVLVGRRYFEEKVKKAAEYF